MRMVWQGMLLVSVVRIEYGGVRFSEVNTILKRKYLSFIRGRLLFKEIRYVCTMCMCVHSYLPLHILESQKRDTNGFIAIQGSF